MEEKDLIQNLKIGNHAAFNELMRQYSNRVVNTCYRFLLNQLDAEDIVQEVFIEIYQSIATFRSESKLSTWIYRIAVTKCLDEIKKRNRKKRLVSLGKMLHLEDIALWLAGGSMPDNQLKEDEKMQEIMSALNVLPDNQRVAFTLSKIEGYTNTEIAEILNTTTVAVESLVYRAKKQVSGELENILKNND
jgi:RNA polymerase sigma-70 factor, ECF subfamily